MRIAAIVGLVTLLAVGAGEISSCSTENGSTGQVYGVLNVPSCWAGSYILDPNFFAATPYMSTLEIRIQKGGDYETFSDGVEILIDDTSTIIPSEYGKPLTVSLPAGVTPVGVPLATNEHPSIVHLSLYLQATCQIQDVALYALDAVTLNPNGNCDVADGGEPVIVCPGSASGLANPEDAGGNAGLDAGASDAGLDASELAGGDGGASGPQPVGHSVITFTSLFNGDENAVSAPDRFNQGTFDVYLADPREVCPGGVGPPPPCRGYLHGQFAFYFERGRPAQPFP